MLADSAMPPSTLLAIGASFAWLVSVTANIVMIINSGKKREITFGFVPAAKADFDKWVGEDKEEHAKLFARIGGVERGAIERVDALAREWRAALDAKIRELESSNDHGCEKLHGRIDEVLKAVSRLEGRVLSHRSTGFDTQT